jgi:hypothetical protein
MVSIRLQQACGKYINAILRMERRDCDTEWSELIGMENERVRCHNVFLDALRDEGIQYADRNETLDIALAIANGKYHE